MRGSDVYTKFCELDTKYKERQDEEILKREKEEEKIVYDQLIIINEAISKSLANNDLETFINVELSRTLHFKTKRLLNEKGWNIEEAVYVKINQMTWIYSIYKPRDALERMKSIN